VKIIRVSWQGFALPFRKTYVTARGAANVRYGLLLFLHTDDGPVGLGEASPVGAGSTEEIRETAAYLEGSASNLLGLDPALHTNSLQHPLLGLPAQLRFGLETALLDLKGKSLAKPLASLLGGTPSSLPVNAVLASDSPAVVAAEAINAVTQGFHTIKLKVAQGSFNQDKAMVSAVREAVGPDIKIRLDANLGWSVSEAIGNLQRLEPYGLEYVEDPVPGHEAPRLPEVRSSVSVAIAADETLDLEDPVLRQLAIDNADVLVIKAARSGGLYKALDMVRLGTKKGKQIVVTSSLESGVGIAAGAHLASTLVAHPFAHGLATGPLLESDLLTASPFSWAGTLAVPVGLGLGVSVDEGLFEKYSIPINGSVGA
jgi:o-succinylbenzoate synthase